MDTERQHAESGCTDYLQHPWESCPENKAQHSLFRDIGMLIEHAKEMYPHFESTRGQQDIAKATEALAKLRKVVNHADKLAEALTWIKEVVNERKGTAMWLQMVEDKTRNALRDYEAAQ